MQCAATGLVHFLSLLFRLLVPKIFCSLIPKPVQLRSPAADNVFDRSPSQQRESCCVGAQVEVEISAITEKCKVLWFCDKGLLHNVQRSCNWLESCRVVHNKFTPSCQVGGKLAEHRNEESIANVNAGKVESPQSFRVVPRQVAGTEKLKRLCRPPALGHVSAFQNAHAGVYQCRTRRRHVRRRRNPRQSRTLKHGLSGPAFEWDNGKSHLASHCRVKKFLVKHCGELACCHAMPQGNGKTPNKRKISFLKNGALNGHATDGVWTVQHDNTSDVGLSKHRHAIPQAPNKCIKSRAHVLNIIHERINTRVAKNFGELFSRPPVNVIDWKARTVVDISATAM
eukprot:m.214656 g.214656  ORF g.214656 m.214656 type:complete len:340 (-) comp18621_c0_seq14:427-1446(-)